MELDELAQHLESLQRESCYRVDAVLKESPVEITQRVFFKGNNGAESGPYIRKFIRQGFGVGGAYERIFEAQQRGHRFKYIPDLLECYAREDELVVVMELVRGKTLQEAVYELDPSVQLAMDTFPKLCDAVGELHDEFDPPIIHRDLKPSNIILTGEGLALIDFGISRDYNAGAESDTTHFGTREFAPPEQFGFGQTGVYSDIYSLGMVLYFCLTEEIPTARTRERSFYDARIPESIRLVIEQAVNLDPAERFPSTVALKDAFLKAAGAARNAKAQRQVPDGKQARSSRRILSKVGMGIGVFACICVATALVAVIGQGVMKAQTTTASSTEATADSAQDAQSDEPTASEAMDAASETQAAEMERFSTEPKNGFDPLTNFTVTVAGVEFQIPSYFKAKTNTSGEADYYYAESGSSVAMIMTQAIETGNITRQDFDQQKEDLISGFMESDDVFETVTSSTDCELAGRSARVVTIEGTLHGLTFSSRGAFFFNPDTLETGAVFFGQSNNTQFDYSDDFTKVIASATEALPTTSASSASPESAASQ